MNMQRRAQGAERKVGGVFGCRSPSPTALRAARVRPRRRFPAEVLTEAEAKALIDACGDGRVTGMRNAALLAVLYRCGLRLGEALALRPKDLDAAHGTLRVLFGKGGRARTVGIDAGALGYLSAWLDVRARMRPLQNSPLFCTAYGGAITQAYVRQLLPRLARQAGVLRRVHAHGFRHTHAAELRREGVDILLISRQLGHTNLLTTVHYLNSLAPTAVVDAIRARAWASAAP